MHSRVSSRRTALATVAALFAVTHGLPPAIARADDLWRQPNLRRPVAMVVSEPWLWVANQRSGTISVVDLERRAVVNEVPVGRQLTDLAELPATDWLVATDQDRHQLVLLRRQAPGLEIVERLAVPLYPVTVAVSADGSFCSVASLWSRRVTLVAMNGRPPDRASTKPRLRIAATIDLPFAPRAQWMQAGGPHLVVADAFGGRLAVVNTTSGKLVALHSLEGHNVRGLAASQNGDELLVPHQLLNDRVPTVRARITWGAVVSNVLRRISLAELVPAGGRTESSGPPVERKIARWRMLPLGETGCAGGDPARVLETDDGMTLVSLAGVDLVAVAEKPAAPLRRIAVGRRPTALALADAERTLLVANTLGDSVSIISLTEMAVAGEISLGPQPELAAMDRGESLFYDARVSHDGWYSCHSCHTDGHTNGRKNDNQGDQSYGAPKRVLSLLGTGQTNPWAWDGHQRSIATQIRTSILVTMQGPEAGASARNVADLETYLRNLEPPPSLAEARNDADRAAADRGRRVFQQHGCADCHAPPTFTSFDTFDVGLRDELGTRKFNPPSLLGVSQRGPYFHDNRAASLRDVFTQFGHGGASALGEQQLDDLLEMLRGL